MYSLKLSVEPGEEPITLTEVKEQLRITITDDDVFLKRLIAAARKIVEHDLGRSLITQTWDLNFDCFPYNNDHAIKLYKPPLISIESIKYDDENGVEQTWDAAEYVVDVDGIKGSVYPDYGYSWPNTRHFKKAVRIKYSAGYGSAADVPEDIKQAILLIVGHLERNRENTSNLNFVEIPIGAYSMLAPYKIYSM